MISSLVGSPSGGSTTTSQCSKSQPSRRIVSLGGLLDQLGLGSFREDDVACDERPLTDTSPPRNTEDKAATRGRDLLRREDAGALARGADEAKDRVKRKERDFAGRQRMEREMECVAIEDAKTLENVEEQMKTRVLRRFNSGY